MSLQTKTDRVLSTRSIRRTVKKFEKESYKLIGEYFVTYRRLLYTVACIVEWADSEKSDTPNTDTVEKLIEGDPAVLRKALKLAGQKTLCNQTLNNTIDVLREATTIRNCLAHAQFEHDPIYIPSIGEPYWMGRSRRTGDKHYWLSLKVLKGQLKRMRSLGKPLSDIVNGIGLQPIGQDLRCRPPNDNESTVASTAVGYAFGMTLHVDDSDPTIRTMHADENGSIDEVFVMDNDLIRSLSDPEQRAVVERKLTATRPT